jgi:hypothetical protein
MVWSSLLSLVGGLFVRTQWGHYDEGRLCSIGGKRKGSKGGENR